MVIQMEKIAIISDIHGNLEALKEVLKDIEKKNIKRIFCLGDIIAKGVHPKECIELVRKNCEIVLQGNCDEYFSRNRKEEDKNKTIIWNQKMLSEDDKIYLQSLSFCHEFYMSGSLIRLFHASPTEGDKMVSIFDSLEEKYKQFLPSDKTKTNERADVIIYGHTHAQDLEKLYNRTLINTGSVGNTTSIIRDEEKDANIEEITQAHYLIIEGKYQTKTYENSLSFQFVKVPYNIQKELESKKTNICIEEYEKELLEGRYRDIEKLEKQLQEKGIEF